MHRLEVIERLNHLLSETVALSEAIGSAIRINTWTEPEGNRINIADVMGEEAYYSLTNYTEPHVSVWCPKNPDDWTSVPLANVPYVGELPQDVAKGVSDVHG